MKMGLREIHRQIEFSPFYTRKESTKLSNRNDQSGCQKVISLQEVNIQEEFDIVKTLAEGCFSKVLLAKQNGDRMVLKAIHCEATSAEDFSRELNYNYFLSPHPNIVTSYNVAFMWDNCFIYVQEYAMFGDLSRFVKKGGLHETQVKAIAQQVTSAVEFIHSFNLVHRDLRLENILVFRKDMTLVKLCDFGCTRPVGTLLSKTTTQSLVSFSPPEIHELLAHEKYHCNQATDVWQLGIILISCLTGSSPWSAPEITDALYRDYVDWQKRKTLRTPDPLLTFTPRFLRLIKRIMEPKPGKRYKIQEMGKYWNDDWVIKGSVVAALRRISVERHESNATSRSGHRQRYTRKRSTRSLVLDTEMEKATETVNERVGKWIDSSVSSSHLSTATTEKA